MWFKKTGHYIDCFKAITDKQLVKLKDKFSAQEVIEVIQDASSLNEVIEKFKSEKSLNFDITNEIPDDIVLQLGKVMRNNKIAKKIIEDFMVRAYLTNQNMNYVKSMG